MPSESRYAAWSGHRLHPLSIVFGLGSAARNLLLPGLAVWWAARDGNYELWLMILFVPAAIGTVVRYWSFRYRFEPEEMVVRDGILTRNERHIPYARIQNIDQIENPIHRMFGVSVVRVETASGGRPEAVIRVLSVRAVNEMRDRVFRGRAATQTEDERAEHPLLEIGPRDLMLLGLISNRGMAVIAAALGVAWQLDPFDRVEKWLGSFKDDVLDLSRVSLNPITTALVALIGIVLVLVGLRVLSMLWHIVRFYGFRLRRSGDDLRVEYGLFTRVSATIPRHRIQLVSRRDTPVYRWFGRTSIQIETAGGGQSESDGVNAGKLWLAPLIPREHVARLVREILPEIDLDALDWRPLARRAGRRVRNRSLILASLIAIVAVAALGLWGVPVAAAAIPLAILHAQQYVRHTGYALAPTAVAFRSGWWQRRSSVVRFSKIQVLALGESPFDRRHRMASVRVDTAGAGRVGHRIDVPYLERDLARGVLDRLYEEAGRTSYRW